MCGITGIVSRETDLRQKLLSAEKIQLHRGPNAQGIMQQKIGDWTVGLGCQRLAILDLSEAGNQPMVSDDGSSCLVYNGEVYNYRELRDELQKLGHRFKSSSDTEVVLKALMEWGPEKALNKFNGMWGFAWLDATTKKLVIARDRMGVKPFYYYITNDHLCFASELKTILALAGKKFSLNLSVIGQYLDQYLTETYEESILKEIVKLPAAHFGIIDLSREKLQAETYPYWTLNSREQTDYSEEALPHEIRELFIDAVKLRLRSDVPMGVALSGGVDSSCIAGVANMLLRGYNTRITLFSAVSDDPRFDESPFIDIVAKYLKLDVHKVNLNAHANNIIHNLEECNWYNDRPVSGFSSIAYYLLMKFAKEIGVTVVLSGQGGDEALCGYRKYLGFYLQLLTREKKFLQAGKVLWDFYRAGTHLKGLNFSDAKRYLPAKLRGQEVDIYGPRLRSHIKKINIGLPPLMTIQERQALDITKFSVPALVHYEDRMSMAWSREVRLPFLDYRMIEKLVPLPIHLKMHKGWSKYIFRKALEPFLPKNIIWRKDKRGFTNPASEWLKHIAREKVLEFFRDGSSLIYKYGLVDQDRLLLKYDLFSKQAAQKGRVSENDIFNPLSLEIWLRKYAPFIS